MPSISWQLLLPGLLIGSVELPAEDLVPAPPSAGDLSGVDPQSVMNQASSYVARLIQEPLTTVEQTGLGLFEHLVRTGRRGNRQAARDAAQDHRAQRDRHAQATWDLDGDVLLLEADPSGESGLRRTMNALPSGDDGLLRRTGWTLTYQETVRFAPIGQAP